MNELSELLANVLPRYLEEPCASKYIRFWEEYGFHLTLVHLHQPILDARTLTEGLWAKDSELIGVEMNRAGQLDVLRNAIKSLWSLPIPRMLFI